MRYDSLLAGTTLDSHPSTAATWMESRIEQPDTERVLPPPHSKTVNPATVLGDVSLE